VTLKDKQELVRLLNLYQVELFRKNTENVCEALDHKHDKWAGTYFMGVKAQYEHARCIATKLSVEIGKAMKSYYEL